ncbi:hypothetical protein [Rhodococcus sp. 14-2470-1a]|uniref:hypothetical protein n=1 Tax=Rhodococcus sp. 14-2470-1a TaxID=2023150 RepID=UPI000B9B60CB|nr:hypothetical protein [Rhodococcus sp. 14-2470-1a]OZF44277.1 hypothetical protein CH292_24585 [Rhodococcus sp. 14-2470-1a]
MTDEPLFELTASAADPSAYGEASERVAAIRERTRPARERRAAREAEAAAWEALTAAWVAQVDDAVAASLTSVLDQRHSRMLGPLPRQRERLRYALMVSVDRWFLDVHPTWTVDDYPVGRVTPGGFTGLVGTRMPGKDEVQPWTDPVVLGVASVLGDGPVAARRAVQNLYGRIEQTLSWMRAGQIEDHLQEMTRLAAGEAKYIDFDSDRCLRDGQEQK